MSGKFRSPAQLVDGKWVWKTKTGKEITRTQEQMDAHKKLLEKARQKRKENQDTSTSAKDSKPVPTPVPTPSVSIAGSSTSEGDLIKRLMKEMKQLKKSVAQQSHSAPEKKEEKKEKVETEGEDTGLLIVDPSNPKHAKYVKALQDMAFEVNERDHEHQQESEHDKVLKSHLLADATVIVPTQEHISEEDKKHIREDVHVHTAIFEFEGERLDETDPVWQPAPTGLKRKYNGQFIQAVHDDSNEIDVPADIITSGKIEFEEARLQSDTEKICVPRVLSLKCELTQVPRIKCMPKGYVEAAQTHPLVASMNDTCAKFDVWVMEKPPVTKSMDALCGTDIENLTVDNIKDTPYGEDPYSRKDFEIRAGVQPDNTDDIMWHAEYQVTKKQFYETGNAGGNAIPMINDEKDSTDKLVANSEEMVYVKDKDVDMGVWLPAGALFVKEKYSFQNQNIDPTTPPMDTNDLLSIQYVESCAKFRITVKYMLTYWSPQYFLDNPHFDGRKYRPDAMSSFMVEMTDDEVKDKDDLVPIFGDSYIPSYGAKVGRRKLTLSYDPTRPVQELWDERNSNKIRKELMRIKNMSKIQRLPYRKKTGGLRGAVTLVHIPRDITSVISSIMKCVGSLGGGLLGAFFVDRKGRRRYGVDPTAPYYFPNSFQGATYTPSEDGNFKRVKHYGILLDSATHEEYSDVKDDLVMDNSGPGVDRCNVGSTIEPQCNFLGCVPRFRNPSSVAKEGYNLNDDTRGAVIDALPIQPAGMAEKNVAIGATMMFAFPNTGTYDPQNCQKGQWISPEDLNTNNPNPTMHNMAAVPVACDTMQCQAAWFDAAGNKKCVASNYISGILCTAKSQICQNAVVDQSKSSVPMPDNLVVYNQLPREYFGLQCPSTVNDLHSPYSLVNKLPASVSTIGTEPGCATINEFVGCAFVGGAGITGDGLNTHAV